VSSRTQAEGRAQVNIMEKAVQSTRQRNLEGNVPVNVNSFSILQDDAILDKALEIGIDVASIPLTTIHLLKDLESARDNLAKKKSVKNVVSKVVEVENENNSEEDTGFSGAEADFDEFTPVVSRKTKKNLKKLSGGKKSNQGVPLCGTKSL
jgi:hypothetical protein